MTERAIELKKAVPYLRLFKRKTFVIKVGGEVLADDDQMDHFVEQVGLLHQLNISLILVHGGGPQVTSIAERLGIPVQTVHGRRVTDAETLEIAKMVFNGKLNTDLLACLQKHHVPGVGLSGVDAGLIRASRRPVATVEDEDGVSQQVDYGFVGDIVSVDVSLLRHLLAGSFVPVVSALAGDDEGAVYNVNADTIAARLAGAIQAEKLVILTGVAGVFKDPEDPRTLISHMDAGQLEAVLHKGARGGMKVKLEACREALRLGVPRTHIISGTRPDSLLVEIFTNEGSGTLIEKEGPGGPAS